MILSQVSTIWKIWKENLLVICNLNLVISFQLYGKEWTVKLNTSNGFNWAPTLWNYVGEQLIKTNGLA